MDKITPCLWFDGNAEQAMEFYASVFGSLRVTRASYRPAEGGARSLLAASFELEGREFMALNGGPHFKFNEAISLSVSCETQAEVDAYWGKLSAGGATGQCGWLKDKFGLSWQIVPRALPELLGDPDPARSQRALQAMLQMTKIEIAALERAADG